MPYPTIDDDGVRVILDLHGATVTHGTSLVSNTISACVRRGRSSLKIIHGSSTYDRSVSARTLKKTLRESFEAGHYVDATSFFFPDDGSILVSLTSDHSGAGRISIFDVDN